MDYTILHPDSLRYTYCLNKLWCSFQREIVFQIRVFPKQRDHCIFYQRSVNLRPFYTMPTIWGKVQNKLTSHFLCKKLFQMLENIPRDKQILLKPASNWADTDFNRGICKRSASNFFRLQDIGDHVSPRIPFLSVICYAFMGKIGKWFRNAISTVLNSA